MRVQLRVRRASVWLSSRVLARADGFLALVRTQGSTPHVAYGALEDAATKPSTPVKRWSAVPIKYSDGNDGRQAVHVEVEGGETAAGSCVEIVLFVVTVAGQPQKQRIACIARTSLRLDVSDLVAVADAQEVVFTSPLEGELGCVEIAVQRADVAASAAAAAEGGGSFSVQWTSSEALDRDLAAKERSRLENEFKLLERLVVVEANAQRAQTLRAQALELVRHKRAAIVIQSAYRGWRRRRRELRRRLRREHEEIERTKKAALRAKVVERNQQRTQRLLEQWTTDTPTSKSIDVEQSPELATWLATQREATQRKLHATLARLAAERDAKLQAMGYASLHSSGSKEPDLSSRLLSDGLLHAIQRLHLRK